MSSRYRDKFQSANYHANIKHLRADIYRVFMLQQVVLGVCIALLSVSIVWWETNLHLRKVLVHFPRLPRTINNTIHSYEDMLNHLISSYFLLEIIYRLDSINSNIIQIYSSIYVSPLCEQSSYNLTKTERQINRLGSVY